MTVGSARGAADLGPEGKSSLQQLRKRSGARHASEATQSIEPQFGIEDKGREEQVTKMVKLKSKTMIVTEPERKRRETNNCRTTRHGTW